MKPIASFDLESGDIFLESGVMLYPDSIETDARIWGPEKDITLRQPGISIAAIATDQEIDYYAADEGKQRISRGSKVLTELIDRLYELTQTHTLVTWNGLKFDCQVLGQECGPDIALWKKVQFIAENHVDLMYIIFCHKGYYVGLDQALQSLELSKTHFVYLKDGTGLGEMYGGMAPLLWAQGERAAVSTYLRGDVQTLLQYATASQESGYLRWNSAKGKSMYIKSQLIPVKEARNLPLPDVSWMDNPPNRSDFDSWMKEKEYVSATLF